MWTKKIRMLTNKIFVVRKSIIPYFVACKEIKSFLGISDEKQIVMQYDWQKWYLGGTKRYFVYNARKMFDSWSHRPLKEKTWDVYIVKKQIKQKINVESKLKIRPIKILKDLKSRTKRRLSGQPKS